MNQFILRCPECDKLIATNTTNFICGYCHSLVRMTTTQELTSKDVMKTIVTSIQGSDIESIGITELSIFIWLKTQTSPIVIIKSDLKE